MFAIKPYFSDRHAPHRRRAQQRSTAQSSRPVRSTQEGGSALRAEAAPQRGSRLSHARLLPDDSRVRHKIRYTGQAGVAALEFVLVLPFLLMILFGIIDVSLLYHDKLVLDNAAREAARAISMYKVPPLTASQEQTLATTVMTTYTSGSLLNASATATPTLTLTHLACDSTITQCPGANALGMAAQVQLSYSYRGLVLGSAFSALTGLVNISSTSLMYYE